MILKMGIFEPVTFELVDERLRGHFPDLRP
jgi:hypothetical protein